MSRRRKIVMGLVGIGVVGFLVLQVIPVGSFRESLRRDANPPVLIEIEWDSAETEAMVRRACFDCHSNETVYPWYAQIAPVSWLVTRDVNRGRAAMNFSERQPSEHNLADMEWHVFNNMPPRKYLVLHPEAQLSEAEKQALVDGFEATFSETSHDGMDMSEG